MAHQCIFCDGDCFCGGDIDDVHIMKNDSCVGCGCQLQELDDDSDEPEFQPCERCDGHAACEDFGCAIELGLGKMVKKNVEPGNDFWG